MSSQADWYWSKIVNITAQNNGSVTVRVNPGDSETRFSSYSVIAIASNDIGAKFMMATLLTVHNFGSEISVNVVAVTNAADQEITGIKTLAK